MVVEESRRLALYKIAQEHWGDAGTTLIEMLPASGFEPASRHDVEHTRVELRAEILASRSEVDTLLQSLRTDLDTTRTELRTDMIRLEARVATELAALRGELQAQRREQTMRLLTFMIPSIFSGVALAFAAARLA